MAVEFSGKTQIFALQANHTMSSASKLHRYTTAILWTGNRSEGTSDYRGYERSHEINVDGKPFFHVHH
ncbi:MAG: hypothetical protein ACK478_01345 [Flavobacteriales bacterium]